VHGSRLSDQPLFASVISCLLFLQLSDQPLFAPVISCLLFLQLSDQPLFAPVTNCLFSLQPSDQPLFVSVVSVFFFLKAPLVPQRVLHQWQGFLKGVGKGMIGAFAKPTAGLIDFATDTASAVKEATRGPVCAHVHSRRRALHTVLSKVSPHYYYYKLLTKTRRQVCRLETLHFTHLSCNYASILVQRVTLEVKRLQRYIPPEKIIVPYNEDDAQGQRILNSVIALERSDNNQDGERGVCVRKRKP
jgi:hypothetical protein